MESEKFEKRRKGVETLLDIIFWINLVSVVVAVLFKIFYLTGLANHDIISFSEIIIDIISTVFIYISARLAHKGHIAAGIIGIIVALIEILFAGLLWKIIGILLMIDSIMYLVNYNKKTVN